MCSGNENIIGPNMPKRLHDTAIWRKQWFMDLEQSEKLAIIFIFDECDFVGVWTPNFRLAEFHIGSTINWKGLIDKCNGNIEILSNEKWWVKDYCMFQYGKVDPDRNSKLMQNVVTNLKKHGLLDRVLKMDATVDATVDITVDARYKEEYKEKNKDKEKDKEKKKEKEKKEYAPAVTMTEEQYAILLNDYGNDITSSAIEKLSVYKMSRGCIYKSDYHAILNWVITEVAKKDRALVKAENTVRAEEEIHLRENKKEDMDKLKEKRMMSKMKITELRAHITKKENGTQGDTPCNAAT